RRGPPTSPSAIGASTGSSTTSWSSRHRRRNRTRRSWMGAGSERSIRQVAAHGFNLLLGQYASLASVASYIAAYKAEVEARGRRFDPMQVGVTRAFFVTDAAEERETALERRLQNRVRQLKLATWPDGTVLGGPDRATGDPRTINEASAMYGTPDGIAKILD